MTEVVSAADREELIVLANHPALERHVPARSECEKQGIDWDPASSAGRTADERKSLYASDESAAGGAVAKAAADFLSPSDADRAIKMVARRVDDALFDPPPGITTCLVEAMGRASAEDRAAIATAAEFLSELVECARSESRRKQIPPGYCLDLKTMTLTKEPVGNVRTKSPDLNSMSS
jgi:hypothetical protein